MIDLSKVHSYLPILVALTIVVNIFYFTLGNWEYLTALNNCITLPRVLTGYSSKCISIPDYDSCHAVTKQKVKVYGWCNDDDKLGPLPGNAAGPYGTTCKDWAWTNN